MIITTPEKRTNLKSFRICFLFFVLSIAAFDSQAQKSKYKLADKYFRTFDYVTASEIYRDILTGKGHESDTVALRRLAECEWKMGNLTSAESIMEKAVAITKNSPSDLLAIAELKRRQGKYEEAVQYYSQYRLVRPDNLIASQYAEQPSFAQEIKKDSTIYSIIPLQVNTAASDFAPSFYSSGKLIFASSNGVGKGGKKEYLWNNQPYLNIFQSSIKLDSTLSDPVLMDEVLNSRYHEGTVSYDYRSNTMYFSRNNFLKGSVHKSKSGQLNLGIYTSKDKEGIWGSMEAFEHNNKEYSVAHPSISLDGSKMYFVSDKPGGMGGTDIYVSKRKGDSWEEPVNVGASVNTSGNEMFPYIVGDSTLYFSSEGLVGLGGMDVFYVNLNDSTAVARNMGYPLNTRYDDFGLICFPSQMAGYFCSNRPGGKGDDDIYLFKLHPPDSITIHGIVVDADTNLPIPNAKVWTQNLDGQDVQVSTDNEGRFTLTTQWREVLELNSSKKDYTDGWQVVKPSRRSSTMDGVEIKMKKYDFVAKGKVLFAENNLPAKGAIVKAIDENGIEAARVTVGADGTYFLPLAQGQKYTIEAAMEGYITLTTDVDTSDPNKKVSDYDFKLFKPEKGTIVRLDNIYYDYNKAAIRPDAALELNKLVRILKDFPTMKIELGSHSDSRGGDSYNLSLSEKRAKSAVEYLISQGIDAGRMVPKGYGETKLLNKCDDGTTCTDEEHSYNRRTEFKILDI
jgi:outer membrane protein OmpA-like peptidoglycan-associated protein/tetratricopeptide (TPR) repeat protein